MTTETASERTLSGGIKIRPVASAPRYWVSDRGRVYYLKRGRLRRMKQQTNPDGYRRVTLYVAGAKVSLYVHRLVLLAFVGPCPAGLEACHGDGNQKNNHLTNLRWDTPKMNAADRIRHRYGSGYVPGSIWDGT